MAGIPDYSTTPGSNSTINSIDVAENCAPSTINNAIRQLMADAASQSKVETVSGTDTYTVTLDSVPTAYSTQMVMVLLFTNANTSTTPTLNVNSLGAKTIVDAEGGALAVGAIAASSTHLGIYDGTSIRLLTVNSSPTLTSLVLTGTSSNLGTVTTVDINGGTLDGVTIGGASAGAGTFTSLSATGVVIAGTTTAGPHFFLTKASPTSAVEFLDGGVSGAVKIQAVDYPVTVNRDMEIVASSSIKMQMGGSVVGDFTSTGLNSCAIGATTPSTGAFTTLSASGAISANGGQIAFPASQNASSDANTLDDYEEGGFTPTLIGSSTAGTQTYVTQVGRYTKVGNRVFFEASVEISAKDAGIAGNVLIGGLPFAHVSITGLEAAVAIGAYNGFTFTTNYTQMTARIEQAAQSIALLQQGSGQAIAAVPVTGLAASSLIVVTGSYQV